MTVRGFEFSLFHDTTHQLQHCTLLLLLLDTITFIHHKVCHGDIHTKSEALKCPVMEQDAPTNLPYV